MWFFGWQLRVREADGAARFKATCPSCHVSSEFVESEDEVVIVYNALASTSKAPALRCGACKDAITGRDAHALVLATPGVPERLATLFLPREEDARTVRKTFLWLSLAAALLLLPPRQWVSSAIMGVVTLGVLVWHLRQSAKEEAAKKSTSPAAKPPSTASDTAPDSSR